MVFSRLFGIALSAALLVTVSARADTTAQDARNFITDLAVQANSMLSDQSITPRQRRDRFREIFRRSFDVPEVAQFVLGRYWRRAKADEREEYLRLFEQLVIGTWAPRFAQYEKDKFVIVNARAGDAGMVRVSSVLSFGDSEPFRVDWWVSRWGDSYRIADIVVEGMSMRITHRSEFASVIRRNGGRLEGLLQALRKKARQLSLNAH